MLRVPGEGPQALGIGALQQAEGQVLPGPHVDLPEPGIGVQGQALGPVKGFGGAPGPVEVAGPDPIDGDLGEARLQGRDLQQAVGGDPGVELPVEAAVDVALGLGVTDQVKSRHLTAP